MRTSPPWTRLEGSLSIQASLVNASSGATVPLAVERHSDKSIDWESNDNWTSYADAGFSAIIDPAVMLEEDASTAPANWHVLLTVSAGGRTIAAPLTRRDLNGSTGQLPVGPMLGTSRMAVEMRPSTTGLTFVPVTPLYVATSVELAGRTLTLTVEAADAAPVAAKISIECRKFGIRKTATFQEVDGNRAVYVIDVPALGRAPGNTPNMNGSCAWKAALKGPQPVAWPEGTAELESRSDQTRSLRLGLTGYGFITVEERKSRNHCFHRRSLSRQADPADCRHSRHACYPCPASCPLQREGRHPCDGRCSGRSGPMMEAMRSPPISCFRRTRGAARK